MYVRIGVRKLFLFLLIATVVNADRIKETTLTCDTGINVCCVALFASFGNVSCEQGFVISVINAHYGYYASNRDVSEPCSIQDDCLVSVPLNSTRYYTEILYRCNDKTRCDSSLVAEQLVDGASCDGFTANDYVSIQFYCLPSDVSIDTVSVCASPPGQETISCSGNRVIQIVGAILGFQPDGDIFCIPGPYNCHIQPDSEHLQSLRSSCQGKDECEVYAVTSISRGNHPCDSLEYTFETVTYYCAQNSGTLVTGISECRPTPATPSTISVTSVTVSKTSTRTTTSTTSSTVSVTSVASSSSLSASSTTGGATIASEASTYTMVDYNLGNESTTATDASSTDNTTSIIVGCVVGGVVLIIVLLLLLIFFVRRTRNSEDTSSKRRGNSSVNGVNGPLSDNTSMPTHSLGNHPATALYTLEQDQPHPPMYWLAQEPSIAANSLARKQLADCYSEVEDLEQEPYRYLSLYSNPRFYEEIDKPNAGIYVNVTEPSNAAYSLVQETNSTTHPKVEDPVGSASLPVDKPELAKVKIDKEEEKVSALTRHQSVERPPEDDLVLRDNSLYVATETHSPNDAVDELTLTDNDLYV